MALSFKEKQAIVAEVNEVAKSSVTIVAAEYRGVTVGEMNQMRREARENGVTVQVVRNNLAKRAFKDTAFDCLGEHLQGPLLLAFGKEDPGAPARVIKKYAKEYEALEVKVLSIDGKVLSANEIDQIANLPTKEEALVKFMAVLSAPITKLVRTLAEPHSQVVRVMGQVRDKKQQQGEG